MRSLKITAVVSLALLAGACATLEPKYRRPAAPIPAELPHDDAPYPAALGDGAVTAKLAWSEVFTDAKLKAVIDLALRENRDLRTAALNIVKARAQYRVQRAELFPTIAASATAITGKGSTANSATSLTSGTTTGGGSTGTVSTGGTTTGGTTTTTASGGGSYRSYSVEVGVSAYELDLFGRVRSLSKEALEQYFATEEAQRAARVSLIAETATDYVTYAADLQRLAAERQTLAAAQASLKVTNDRFRYGIVSLLDVQQAQTAVETAISDVQTYLTASAQDLNALNLVVGAAVPPELQPQGLGADLPLLATLPAGLSSSVLLGRPDVLQAEHQLRAYNADIGAARAAFFPTISLTASGGSSSIYLSQLFGSGTGSYSFAPNISLPIFDFGKNRANLAISKAQRDIAVASYEKSIQTAFSEVADALAQQGAVGPLIASQERLVAATQGTLTLAQARYDRGADTYLNVLTAQLNLANAQQTLISARLTRASSLIALYRALGGGA